MEALWTQLDTKKQGHLDLNGLKRGLRKIDHRTSPSSRCDSPCPS